VFLGQTFKDPTMIILSVAAVVSLVLGSVPISDSDATNEGPQWIQGLAISIVVIIQTNVMVCISTRCVMMRKNPFVFY
jgi:hypothetical protein